MDFTNDIKKKFSTGICLGASNITLVRLENHPGNLHRIVESISLPHEGSPKEVMKKLFKDKGADFFKNCFVTGRKFKNLVRFSKISEPEAVELAYSYVRTKYSEFRNMNVIVSAGGETFMAYQMDLQGKIINVFTGNKCASGTGEFFLQQLKRVGIGVEEAVKIADLDNPHSVSGRCSVFCKSDCTHALNKGVPKAQVVAGLCKMMATKVVELLKKIKNPNLLLAGGTSQNKVMVEYLKKTGLEVHIPEESSCFEALGAAIKASSMDAIEIKSIDELFESGLSSFVFHKPLQEFEKFVEFKTFETDTARDKDECILGLDVGSTTTKAVIIRRADKAILASIYLRTLGDPIQASKNCYKALLDTIGTTKIKILGLGVTGSGRQIAGLHALTEGVINEIIAHAAAAVYFDPKVDTIFEIGGQDAKYTYITNKVASDYAMNEACSAGTGSFLEESAKESLEIEMEEIGGIAMKANRPPNFNDQCAAFISSDIKSAIQEGIKTEDIVAGLVYSICLNYVNRVKGNRAVGDKVFMQGGVCYNKAVPIAMAALTGKKIIVPPEPGLMGAYGVALEVDSKLSLNLMKEFEFDLKELSNRTVKYKKPFTCMGGKEKCDRRCVINNIEINNKTYPFGGACNKYYNLRFNIDIDVEKLDLVVLREELVYKKYCTLKPKPQGNKKLNFKKIGINNSLLVNTLYPLYYNFFTALGMEVVIPKKPDPIGAERKGAAFCYPVEISYAMMQTLVNMDVDAYFMPLVKGLPLKKGYEESVTCPFVQGEPFYLKAAYNELDGKRVLNPVIDFCDGFDTQKSVFVEIGMNLGCTESESSKAFDKGLKALNDCLDEMRSIGKKLLDKLAKDKNEMAIVLFGRPYNAFTRVANMGIPHKFASRGYRIIPVDFLPIDNEEHHPKMYWSMGQILMNGAKFVKKHDQLFAAFITNFSCGPDSFITSFIRSVMGTKPSLTLELDSHSADAGVDTRIDAFLDVVTSFKELLKTGSINIHKKIDFTPARVAFENGKGDLKIIDSQGRAYPLTHPRVHMLLPTMNDTSTRCIAAAFRYIGINADTLGPNTTKDLLAGRGNSSCKECLPLQLTMGKLLNYLEERDPDNDELLVFFMPETSGPCRFGQYSALIDDLIKRKKIQNVAQLSLTSENSYAGVGTKFLIRGWQATIIGDVLEDIGAGIKVLAKDPVQGWEVYLSVRARILKSIAVDTWNKLKKVLRDEAHILSAIPRKKTLHDVPKVSIIGEIFTRKDELASQCINDKLANKGILGTIAPLNEWVYYCDYIVENKLTLLSKTENPTKLFFQKIFKKHYDRKIKKIFLSTGLFSYHEVDIDHIIENTRHLLNPTFTGEAILTVGCAITDIIDHTDGVISIGPFGCMPNRVAEAIVSEKMTKTEKLNTTKDKNLVKRVMMEHSSLPFFPIESDGNVFPQVIEAKFESFCLQVERIFEAVKDGSNKDPRVKEKI